MPTTTIPIYHDAPPLRVVNGAILVGQTRVPIDTIVHCYNEGMAAESIADNYDALPLPDIYGAIAYYLQHKIEIDEYVARRQEANDALRAEITSTPEYKQRIDRLLTRARLQGLRK